MDASKTVKCVVWDLDNTVWDGVLLEDGEVRPRPGVRETIEELDRRGILNSIASRNDHEPAMRRLTELGLAEYFLYPQINWSTKSASIEAVVEALNIGLDTVAFVDDEPYERAEVAFSLPRVRCLDPSEIATMLDRPDLTPAFVTEDSARRRAMYQADAARGEVEREFAGPREDFLAGLDMRFRIAPAGETDLARAAELTVRTNQLNTTGRTYSYEELAALRTSGDHLLLMARLDDRFGPYGNVGLALVEKAADVWTVKLLLMSCRVMSRGVGTIVVNHVKRMARDAGARLTAEFLPTDRNRMMLVSLKFNQFSELERRGDLVVYEADLTTIPADPAYVRVEVSAQALTH
jgi:FkbH-like protein